MALPELFFSPCQEPPYRISGSTRQFHWKGCLYGAHILGNGRCRSYTSTFHKSFPAQWAVAYLNDILSRETAIVVKHSHPQHSLPVYSHLNAAVFNGLVHWNKIICPRLTVWTSHRINLSSIRYMKIHWHGAIGQPSAYGKIIWFLVTNQTDIAFSNIEAVYHSR